MTDDEHNQIAADFYSGKALFGLDRMVARKFLMDLSASNIEAQTGERPSVEVFSVWALYIIGHAIFLASWPLAYFAFGWWSALAIPVSLAVYILYVGHSSLPGHGLLGITVALSAAIIAAFVDAFPSGDMARYAIALLGSFLVARSVYSAAGHFVRALVLRNRRAFEVLSSHINIRSASQSAAAESMVEVRCPHCQQRLRVPLGKTLTVTCSACRKQFAQTT